jgi:hypothetical protein
MSADRAPEPAAEAREYRAATPTLKPNAPARMRMSGRKPAEQVGVASYEGAREEAPRCAACEGSRRDAEHEYPRAAKNSTRIFSSQRPADHCGYAFASTAGSKNECRTRCQPGVLDDGETMPPRRTRRVLSRTAISTDREVWRRRKPRRTSSNFTPGRCRAAPRQFSPANYLSTGGIPPRTGLASQVVASSMSVPSARSGNPRRSGGPSS